MGYSQDIIPYYIMVDYYHYFRSHQLRYVNWLTRFYFNHTHFMDVSIMKTLFCFRHGLKPRFLVLVSQGGNPR